MNCPCFIQDYFGVCSASDVPYIPSIAEMERYCFNVNFKSCPVFKPVQQGEVKPHQYSKSSLRDYLYSGAYQNNVPFTGTVSSKEAEDRPVKIVRDMGS